MLVAPYTPAPNLSHDNKNIHIFDKLSWGTIVPVLPWIENHWSIVIHILSLSFFSFASYILGFLKLYMNTGKSIYYLYACGLQICIYMSEYSLSFRYSTCITIGHIINTSNSELSKPNALFFTSTSQTWISPSSQGETTAYPIAKAEKWSHPWFPLTQLPNIESQNPQTIYFIFIIILPFQIIISNIYYCNTLWGWGKAMLLSFGFSSVFITLQWEGSF